MVAPEFVVFHRPGFTEYRVENWRLARDGSGRVLMGVSGWRWHYSLVPLLLSLLWPRIHDNNITLGALFSVLAYLVYSKCTQVLHESVVVIPPHGIQLETHRGLPWFSPFAVTRQFIPFASLQDFVIHEGLSGWNVRYYLAAIRLSETGDYQVHVAFKVTVGINCCFLFFFYNVRFRPYCHISRSS
ncbi:Phosphatidylinositol N-acetylglucosaminyltransferase subunit gpi15 [Mycena venus]|uniref:Phosphatidylinositol N-acetylglucosaminyltransferase subunit gpi15 n=1 Tax=Mycena venus TaxID=2733690 RepID=A0A8H6XC81_9AGAR|nr:Phosphatidylinositol N-acetylglucosaminyltransferase subunit gpi15 [Mycena venus]